MLLSIIMPVYHVEKYIVECLESIFSNDKTDWFEVICVDDCGKDKSMELISNYIDENCIQNIKIVTHEENKGLSAARNTGVSNAKGKYIMFLDSDDYLTPNALDTLYPLLYAEAHDFIEINCVEEQESNSEIYTSSVKDLIEIKCDSGDVYFSKKIDINQYYPMAVTKIVKKSLFMKCGGFTEGLFFEDEDYTPRLYLNAGKCACYNVPIYSYRRRDGSITTTAFHKKVWIESYKIIIDNLISLSDDPLAKVSKEKIFDHACNLALSLIKNCSFYHVNKAIRKEVYALIKKEKIWNTIRDSKNRNIRIQSYILRFPSMFYEICNIVYLFRKL